MCHLTLLPGGQYLTVSSYGTGSQIICKLDKDGIPASMSMLEQHEGVGFDSKDRQDGPHVHFSAVAPGNDRILVTDLGLDSVSVYRLDDDNGVMIKDIEENQVYTEPGSGPRHLTFSADGRFWYLVTELNSHVLAFSYDKATGRSNLIEEKPMLPHGFDKYNIASDIHLSPDGKFLYAANRGLNDVVCYSVDAESGSITLCGRYGIHCSMPRTFAVSEKYLVAAGQGDNKVVVLPRDCTTGALSDAVCELSISGAAYVGFFPDFC